jgi:NO-binding membrane sensor protein with MHYT domain
MSSLDLIMAGSYDYRLVALSVLIAMLGSYTTIDLAGRVVVARGGTRLSWLIGGGAAMGIGTWSMHYTGMMAFRLPVPVRYDWPTALLSFLASLFASSVALFVVTRRELGWLRAFAGSVFMGGGIATLHYTGMSSMRLPAMCHYSPTLVSLSIVLAIVISLMSLWLTFLVRGEENGQRLRKAASALLMGAAISVMHYTGMAAVSFRRSAEVPDLSHTVSISSLGIAGVSIVTLMVLEIALLTSLVDRLQKHITERKLAEEQLRATSEQLRALSASFQSAREEEGTRIARELHDELGGALTSLRWDLEEVEKMLSVGRDQANISALREKIAGMTRLIDATINTVKRISAELRPIILDDLGLVAAIEWQVQEFEARSGIICQFDSLVDNADLSREQATALFRILQEALTNILRHAQATRVNITIEEEEGEFVLRIRDNGRGITEAEKTRPRSLGLIGMRERAQLIGGKIEITGVTGKGTVLTVRIPLRIQASD